jgi:tRNA dimethylallyltransferase
MFEAGIIGEAEHIASKYGSEIKPMKSIGLKEVYGLLEGEYGIENCKELITIHTSQLAKRQTTFNKTQINADMRGNAEEVLYAALSLIST